MRHSQLGRVGYGQRDHLHAQLTGNSPRLAVQLQGSVCRDEVRHTERSAARLATIDADRDLHVLVRK